MHSLLLPRSRRGSYNVWAVTIWKAKDEKEFIQGEVCGVGKLQKLDLSPSFQISTQKEKMKKKERPN